MLQVVTARKTGQNGRITPCSGGGAVCYTARLTPLVLAWRHLLDFEGSILSARCKRGLGCANRC
ncbi:hypothetical protein DRM94_04775 [Aeromonas taiwanensis]|uniref:Uncharacterized protein n=1 Tax=Aeromonas taiwanensis TaxID=633417 RepID=A0A5F0KDZ4_9GAMM|nr:hypothetical protein DRM93_04775 [Aeromonas taiwanensis]TFF79802.1 hypothetical protein DRM95_05475 [Aeromonas taiwanensis]TFF82801.1 hypothetical protein DRM94_04775 [Aeromonas taiwanensis]